MSVTVRVPTPLRKFTGGAETVEIEASSVDEAVEVLGFSYPDLTAQIVDSDGKVRRFVNLFVNDEDIRFLDEGKTELKEGDELSIVPAIAGGR